MRMCLFGTVLLVTGGSVRASEFTNFFQFGNVAVEPLSNVVAYIGEDTWAGSYTHTIDIGGSPYDFGSVEWDFGLTTPASMRLFTQGSTQADPTGELFYLNCISVIDFTITQDTPITLTGLMGASNGDALFSLGVSLGSSGAILGLPLNFDGRWEILESGAPQSVSASGILLAGDYNVIAWGMMDPTGSQVIDLTLSLPAPGVAGVGLAALGFGLRRRR